MADSHSSAGGSGDGEGSSLNSASRRSAPDPPSTADRRASPDRARVRFSEDLDRATVNATASSSRGAAGQRPGTPSLTVETRGISIPKKSSEAPRPGPGGLRKSSNTLSPVSPVSPVSPTSPRTRDRGYSLRRTLFARSINNVQSPREEGFELEDGVGGSANRGVGEREYDVDDKRRGGAEGKGKNGPGITVSPVLEDELEIEHVGSSGQRQQRETGRESKKEKKSFGTVNLPNYDIWARKRTEKRGVLRWYSLVKKRVLEVIREKQLPPSRDGRHIDLDASRRLPFIDERTGKEYVGNTIRSSRYTLLNFFPRQLFFQFSKLANFYFLLISILQLVPGLSPTGSYTTIIPLLVFVMISMAKEGYDDVRRYRLDQVENNRTTLVLHAYRATHDIGSQASIRKSEDSKWGLKLPWSTASMARDSDVVTLDTSVFSLDGPKLWATMKWRDVKVGNIIKLNRDDPIPADMVLLHADGQNGIAYIETMALDGETNLKSKQAPVAVAKRCSTIDDVAACRATIVVEDPNLDLYNFDGRVMIAGETLPLTLNEIILRGSTLRNTQTAIGMVINTGEDCKIRMNANKNPRIKAPAMQAISNKIVVMLVVFVIILALFCTIAYQIWTEHTEENAWYLKGAHLPFQYILVGFIILYNTLIPLSLYVSLEIIKVGQLILMADVEMYDPVSDTPMTCNTTTILENLGQVDYVFSDKTGTLTDNVMKFRKLSVAGYAWLHDIDLQKEAAQLEQTQEATKKVDYKGKGIARRASARKASKVSQAPSTSGASDPARASSVRRSGSLWRSTARPSKAQPEMRTEDMLKFMQYKPHSIFTKKARFFLLSLALCHTCLPEVRDNGEIEFQAASPDELALVKAAQELGWLVIDRPAKSVTLTYPGGDFSDTVTETYEVLDVIEFSSKRKRMSIIVRFPNGQICIFCKGADSAILPRLKQAVLAMQKKSEIVRRSSMRKSMEADQALRRMSEHTPRASFSRPSMSLSRPSFSLSRKSIGHGRSSMGGSGLQPIRDELDSWLKQKEHDVESAPDDISAYQSPRVSMNRQSFASSERRLSTYDVDYDDLVDEALVLDNAAVYERCFQHIDDFASEGLRTLLFGFRFLDEQEYLGWKKIYQDATTSLVDRQKLIENAGEVIEQNFELAGATAIEDKLQKGVPETIDKLRRANIKIWMLTGDKRETAINIAHSARICKNYSEVIILDYTTGEVEQRMATALLDISKGSIAHSVVVVDGQTLSEIDSNTTLALLFFDLVILADSVICCRASPSQKASLVKKIRTKVKQSITLAIGDGMNDVAMIQEAHVGIGISGKEGLQAARIADYSIAQFRFLQRLLLVHGRWNYIRTGKYILSTFWKELMFYLIQALYQRWNGYTGTSLFESTSLTVFNTLFTSLPVIFLGIFEQDLAASTLLAVPELYIQGQKNEGFNIKKYLAWMFMAVSESSILYFTMWGLFGEALFTRDDDLLSMGTLAFSGAVIFINTKMLILEMHNKTLLSALGWLLSVGGWFLWTLLLSLVFKVGGQWYLLYPLHHSFIHNFGTNLLWWASLLLGLAAVILFEIGVSSVRKTFWPSDTDVFQELQKDEAIRARFEDVIRRENNGGGSSNIDVSMTKPKSSLDHSINTDLDGGREREILELLRRPRVMGSGSPAPTPPPVSTGAILDGESVVRSPVEVEEGIVFEGGKRNSIVGVGGGGGLKQRKFSIDAGVEREVELGSLSGGGGKGGTGEGGKRHSVDIAEVLRRSRS